METPALSPGGAETAAGLLVAFPTLSLLSHSAAGWARLRPRGDPGSWAAQLVEAGG